jgi:hypothetical protein
MSLHRRVVLCCFLSPLALLYGAGSPAACSINQADVAPATHEAEQPLVRAFWLELITVRWDRNWPRFSLRLSLRLHSVPHDWIRLDVRVPEGYRVGEQEAGDWVPSYLKVPTPEADITLRFRRLRPESTTVRFPVVVTTGERTVRFALYLRSGPEGLVAALAQEDGEGNPLWFKAPGAVSPETGYVESWWAFNTTTSNALNFIAEVSGLQIHLPGKLLSRAGGAGARSGVTYLLRDICLDAGCIFERVADREYRVRFSESYRGAPDASWWVAKRDGGFQFRGDDTPAADLLAALLEIADERMADSPDLAWSTLDTAGYGSSLVEALDAICRAVRPRLTWRLEHGAYFFELASED